ncbi:uncharacterized protein [Salmo salar]|uniref:DUF7869 domain-containing protein n=1 Tax=Salmo salar TaxID=8030 RepID=A0ABM3DL85_SALSA|nr:uncharacterized protein LOC106580812 [Salmo salar]
MKACHPAKAGAHSSTTCTISSLTTELGKRVDMSCDNCSGQSKNTFVLWYCAWWTMHKLHHSLDLHFLITGHTKFAPDWCFDLIKPRFRKPRVNTLSEISRVCEGQHCDRGQHPTAGWIGGWYGAGGSYGWQQHLTLYFRPLPQVKQYQHFRASMLWNLLLLSPRSVRLRNTDILPPIDGLPVQAPPVLGTVRQTYLFEKIREVCDEEAMDITCPAPKSRAGQKQALQI